jgi:hypothetical protein
MLQTGQALNVSITLLKVATSDVQVVRYSAD